MATTEEYEAMFSSGLSGSRQQPVAFEGGAPPALRWPDWAAGYEEPPASSTGGEADGASGVTPAQRALQAQFPMGALVRARVRLAVPAPGEVAVVAGWTAAGHVRVKARPDSDVAMGCQPEWLERVRPT